MTEARIQELMRLFPLDQAITPNGHRLLREKYCLPDESVAHRLATACVVNSIDFGHAQRLAFYMSQGWFMFSTPLLANSGTSRGQSISCFLNLMDDSLDSIGTLYKENVSLTTGGGGLGTHYSKLRSQGTNTSQGSETSGIIPFMTVVDAQITAFNQGKTRRGAGAAWLDISHPEIVEFMNVRDISGGDISRKCLSTHIGVLISDKFMEAVQSKSSWDLIDPHTQQVVETVPATKLWVQLLKARLQNGEPYIYFTDNVIRNTQYKLDDPNDPINFYGSNLCTEILLHTSHEETAVCCLSSVNAAKYFEYRRFDRFYRDMVAMLNQALQNFIDNAPEGYSRAVLSAIRGRDIGLGIMGMQTLLQSGYVPDVEGAVMAHHSDGCIEASEWLHQENLFQQAPRAKHLNRVNTNISAIAPNASSSLGLGVSPGIEPLRSNLFTLKTGGIMFTIRNPALEAYIKEHGLSEDVWEEMKLTDGSLVGTSLEHLADRFPTFAEHDQYELLERAAARQDYIDQGQSLNLCVRPDITAKELHQLHVKAWELGLPTLYYLRSEAATRAENVTATVVETGTTATCPLRKPETPEECLACQ